MDEDLVIRKAKSEDIKAIQKFRGLLVEYEKEELGNELLNIDWANSKEGEASTKKYIEEHYCFVATLNGGIVGIITAKISPERPWFVEKTAILNNLYVEKEYREKGIATKLYEKLCLELKREGITKIELHTMSNNEKAINFYKKLGFESYNIQMLNKKI